MTPASSAGIVDSYIRARGGNVTPEQYTEHHRQEEREAEEAKYQARRALDKLQDAAERVEHWRQLTMFPDIVVPD